MKLSDVLYKIAEERLAYYNPCKFVDGKCERDRFRNEEGACCKGCQSLSNKE